MINYADSLGTSSVHGHSLLTESSCVFQQADPFTVSNYVNTHVGCHEISLQSKLQSSSKLKHRKFACVDLCRISYGLPVNVVSPSLQGNYHLQILLSGYCVWRSIGKQELLAPGSLLIINPDDSINLTYSADCEKFILKLPTSLLEDACIDQRLRVPINGIRFLESHHQAQDLMDLISLIQLVCAESELVTPSVKLQSYYTKIIAMKLLLLVKNNALEWPARDMPDAFEEIIDSIDQNIMLDLSTQSLACQFNMSLRSLYNIFERNLGITPKQYIRQAKLEKVRASLLDPTCNIRTVTEVAIDYGFMHFGRFSSIYKKQFGELPSETLKRQHQTR